MLNRVRCLLAMMGTDVHSKGIRTLAQLLRDAGIEVIYLGEHNTADGVINAALAEDANLIGLSFSTATYLHYTQQLMDKLRLAGAGDIAVMLGGLIHKDDEPALHEMGVKGVFGPGSSTAQILEFIHATVGS